MFLLLSQIRLVGYEVNQFEAVILQNFLLCKYWHMLEIYCMFKKLVTIESKFFWHSLFKINVILMCMWVLYAEKYSAIQN